MERLEKFIWVFLIFLVGTGFGYFWRSQVAILEVKNLNEGLRHHKAVISTLDARVQVLERNKFNLPPKKKEKGGHKNGKSTNSE